MQEWVWEAWQNFCFEFMSTLLNILLRRSRYSSTTYSRLLSWIVAEKNSLLVGGAPISLDYAEFLGTSFAWTFSFVLCLDRFPIFYRYYSQCILEYISFSTHFYYLFSQPDFIKKSLLPFVGTFLDLHVVLLRLGM